MPPSSHMSQCSDRTCTVTFTYKSCVQPPLWNEEDLGITGGNPHGPNSTHLAAKGVKTPWRLAIHVLESLILSLNEGLSAVSGRTSGFGAPRSLVRSRPARQGVSTDSQSFTQARHAQPFYALQAGHPLNGITAVSGVACPQGGWPAAVFYPLGYPTTYGPGSVALVTGAPSAPMTAHGRPPSSCTRGPDFGLSISHFCRIGR
jgi:hypothetical protein